MILSSDEPAQGSNGYIQMHNVLLALCMSESVHAQLAPFPSQGPMGIRKDVQGRAAYLRSFRAFPDLPALHLILTSSEEVDQPDGSEACGDNLWEDTLGLILQHNIYYSHSKPAIEFLGTSTCLSVAIGLMP